MSANRATLYSEYINAMRVNALHAKNERLEKALRAKCMGEDQQVSLIVPGREAPVELGTALSTRLLDDVDLSTVEVLD